MLGDGGDDGDVVLGVGGVQQRVETTGPGSNFWEAGLRKYMYLTRPKS